MRNSIQSERVFQLLYRAGKRFLTAHCVVYVLDGNVTSHAHAIIVPNAVIPVAARRNLVRRRIRSIINTHQGSLRGKIILVSVKKDISKFPFPHLHEELRSFFESLSKSK